MKSKSKRFARGGKVHSDHAPKNAGVYSGGGSNVLKEAKEKGGGFKRGGKVAGAHAPTRLDRGGRVKKARGGAVGGSPFSSASKLSNLPAKGSTDARED